MHRTPFHLFRHLGADQSLTFVPKDQINVNVWVAYFSRLSTAYLFNKKSFSLGVPAVHPNCLHYPFIISLPSGRWCRLNINERNESALTIGECVELTTHNSSLFSHGSDSCVGLIERRYGIGMLLVSYVSRLSDHGCSIVVLPVGAVPHFNQHAEIDTSKSQGPEREKNCEVRGAADMISPAPISVWPRETMPDNPSYLTKVLFTAWLALFCAILMWFAVPAVVIGIDQGFFPLLIAGILAVVGQSAAILYIVDLWLL
jgi:hypothetical protein